MKRSEQLARLSSFATLIDIASSRAPGEATADILARSTGISVQRYGGPGALAVLSIRGADPGEIEVFLDRTPLRTAAQSMVDLSTLDLSQIESIEVYRSVPPTDLGGEASGAAIRLVTANTARRQTVLRATSGSYGTTELEALASGSWRRYGYLFSASRFETDGDFRYFSDNGTPHASNDDSWLAWSNGASTRDLFFGKLDIGLPFGLDLEWSTQGADRRQGVPGMSGTPTVAARLAAEDWLHRFEITTDRKSSNPQIHFNLYGFAERKQDHYEDPLRELAVTGTPSDVEQRTTRDGVGLYQRVHWVQTPGLGQHSLELLAEMRRERLRREPPPGHPTEDQRQRDGSLISIGDNWEALAGKLHANAFYRWEETSDNYTGSDPYRPFSLQAEHRASSRGPNAGVRLTPLYGLTLKANAARQTRFPTFAEMFGYYGAIAGNPALEPETGWRWDAGWLWEPEGPLPGGIGLRNEIAYYENRTEDMIVFVLVSNRQTKPLNLDAARIRGCEMSCALEHLPLLRDLAVLPSIEALGRRMLHAAQVAPAARTDASLAIQTQWQDARDEGVSPIYAGKQLTYHPEWRAQIQLDLVQGRWQIRYLADYRDKMYWARSNLSDFECPAQWRHDLTLRCNLLGERLAASLRVENLANARLEDVRGYPLPGRSWFSGLEVRL